MMRTLALLSVVVATHCAEVTWTGLAKDNQWATASNWHPAGVPGADDDVSIYQDWDAGVDETIVIVQPTHVRVLIIGALSKDTYKSHLRVFNSLIVSAAVQVSASGTLELSSEVAALTTPRMLVFGTFQFTAGALLDAVTSIYYSGVADFGGQTAKVFYNSSISISSDTATAMSAAGSLQFRASSKISSSLDIVSTGQNFQCIVTDDSVGNSFTANGFSWKQ